jgi:uncharacterized Zn finger protein
MYVSGERVSCLRQLIAAKEFACHKCGSGSFIIKEVQWSMRSPLTLEVDMRCAKCGAVATIALSWEEARRCGIDDPNEGLRRDIP